MITKEILALAKEATITLEDNDDVVKGFWPDKALALTLDKKSGQLIYYREINNRLRAVGDALHNQLSA